MSRGLTPHHCFHHNRKDGLVFDCSFSYQGHPLNEPLFPGPTLRPPLTDVLLQFRRYGDIRAMFHQVRLIPDDQLLPRFVWSNLRREKQLDEYQWQVLPSGPMSNPCYATFALQRHTRDHVGHFSFFLYLLLMCLEN